MIQVTRVASRRSLLGDEEVTSTQMHVGELAFLVSSEDMIISQDISYHPHLLLWKSDLRNRDCPEALLGEAEAFMARGLHTPGKRSCLDSCVSFNINYNNIITERKEI